MRSSPFPLAIVNVALAEVRIVRRMARFWTAVVVLSLCSFLGYVSSCLFFGYSATGSPSFGPGAPKYLLGSIEPTFFLMFQLVALFLLFDAAHRHRRNRIDEVLDSRPVHSFEYLAGRAIGIALLVWFVAASQLIAMQVMGLISKTTNFGLFDSFQFHSLLNLLFLDAPITLLFWCAFVVFISCVVRVRIGVLAIGLIAMFTWYFIVLNASFEYLPIVSPSSNDSLFVSELVPEFASWQTVAVRFASVLFFICLIATGTFLLRRNDSGIRLPMEVVSPLSCVLGGFICAVVAAVTFSDQEATTSWREFHASYEWSGGIDVKQMTGELYIDPKRHLTIDLDMKLSIDTAQPASLAFTLNPGMEIQKLEIDGLQTEYSFHKGLLEVQFPASIALDTIHTLGIVARGVPNPKFAYLDSTTDYLSDSATPRQAIMLLGRDGSVFDSKYVALMPGAYWYPVPGPAKGGYLYSQQGLSYFGVDLLVTLKAKDWQIVGTGTTTESTKNDHSFRLTSNNPLHEFGLFASNFESASLQVNESTFAMHLHKLHSDNLRLLASLEESLRHEIEDRMKLSNEFGLSLSHDTLSFVEVPRRLRTVGGGWRMNSVQALPGVFLLKEHAFPTARMDLLFDRIDRERSRSEEGVLGYLDQTHTHDEEDVGNEKLAQVSGYFSRGMGTDSPWSSLGDFLWTHSTSASGRHSHALHQVMLCLLSELHPIEQWYEPQFFNLYQVLNFAELTKVSLFEGSHALMDLSEGRAIGGSIFATLALREDYTTRVSNWNRLEQTSLSDFPTYYGNEHDLDLLLFKASLIANSLFSVNGGEKIAGWLAAIRRDSEGGTYTLDDAINLANQQDVVVDPFLSEWLHGNSLPGYVASSYTSVRIADDVEGNPQYQTSVNVRNTQSIGGLVRLQYPNEHTWNWDYPFLIEDGYYESQSVQIEANSTRRINLISNYEVRLLYLDPGPSLNRSPFALVRKSSLPNEQMQVNPQPFVEESTWSPLGDNAIIVDDLDAAFSIVQPELYTARRSLVGPIGWLRTPRLEAEFDQGLPVATETYLSGYRVPPGTWARGGQVGAFGHFRKTTAFAVVGDNQTQATFSASLPESSPWQLEYHAPGDMSRLVWPPETSYLLTIANENGSWGVKLAIEDLDPGWNSVGEFELDSGITTVTLTGTPEEGTLFADAIRWTKVVQR